MGSKTAAREVALRAGAPLIPGSPGGVHSLDEARRVASEIGYPVLLKAAAGGGGKGMRRVESEAELEAAIREASSEAERAFGSGEVYLEKIIERARHIEVQVLGDQHGNLIHLGERECTIQRRHQKVLEECPSPLMLMKPHLRDEIGDAAVRIARAVGYFSAGTLEFLADMYGRFYFLEMNTRLQVEHPVTEWVTGMDLVRWQIAIAAGGKLAKKQEDMRWNGSAIECRVYAEDPANNFLPSPGRIIHYREPSGPGIRIDGAAFPGWDVPIEYDPLIAKLSVWAERRNSARMRMLRALSEFRITGIATNLNLFRQVLENQRFVVSDFDTTFLERFVQETRPEAEDQETMIASALATISTNESAAPATSSERPVSRWQTEGKRGQLR